MLSWKQRNYHAKQPKSRWLFWDTLTSSNDSWLAPLQFPKGFRLAEPFVPRHATVMCVMFPLPFIVRPEVIWLSWKSLRTRCVKILIKIHHNIRWKLSLLRGPLQQFFEHNKDAPILCPAAYLQIRIADSWLDHILLDPGSQRANQVGVQVKSLQATLVPVFKDTIE